jgi:hypothetical protein
MSKNFRIITYGDAFAKLRSTFLRECSLGPQLRRTWNRLEDLTGETSEYLLVSSDDFDDRFAQLFRQRATQATRLFVFQNEGASTDRLLSRIVDLQIRTPERLCVVQCSFGTEKSNHAAILCSFLSRLASALEADNNQQHILHATIEDEVLHVVSTDFKRLDVPVSQIPPLASADPAALATFKIDKDGSFIYWPSLDVHLGWEQLFQIINPEAARKAQQKRREFNVRYGKAVQRVREQAGLKPSDISGLSDKQVRRIESGQCRLTSNAIEALAQAHHLEPNAYLQKLAESLSTYNEKPV